MSRPRNFLTQPSAFRSPMSPAAPAHEAETNLDFTLDARAEYLAAERTAPEPGDEQRGLAAALATIARFGRQARAKFPDLNVEVFLVEKSDRSAGTQVPAWGCRASGAALGAARPSTQAATPAQALKQLVALVASLREGSHQQRDARALSRRLPPVCSACRGTLGENAEACTACYQYANQHQAA